MEIDGKLNMLHENGGDEGEAEQGENGEETTSISQLVRLEVGEVRLRKPKKVRTRLM